MSEQKQPQPSEWWESKRGNRLHVVMVTERLNDVLAYDINGSGRVVMMNLFLLDYKHLPDCDSFKWKPEAWPKYYLHRNGFDSGGYLIRDSATTSLHVIDQGRSFAGVWDADHDTYVKDGRWREVTEAEALATIDPPKPAPPKRAAIRFWTGKAIPSTMIYAAPEAISADHREIKYDANGFYVEVQP